MPALSLARCLALFALHGVSSVKTFHTAGRINNLLLARHKRMALGTDLDFDALFCRSGRNHIATEASDGCCGIFRMDTLFHKLSLTPFAGFSYLFSLTVCYYNMGQINSSY